MNPLIIRSPEVFREKQNIDARVGQRVRVIDLSRRQVQVEDLGSGRIYWEPFDQALIASGAVPIRPNLPGIEEKGIYELTTLQSGIQLRQALDRERPRKVIIVGAGYIGLEMAENFILRGLEVSIIERIPQVMGTLDADMAAPIAEALKNNGAKLFLGESVRGFEGDKGKVHAVLTDNHRLAADLVLLGLGVRPNSILAKEAGIPLGPTGAVKVNPRMETEVKGIWAAGNCAESFHLISRKPTFMALGTVANKQGRVAGINIGGGDATFPGVVGTAMVKVFDLEVARTGLNEKEISELGLDFISAKIEGRTKAGYYPGAAKMIVKVLAEKGSGRLLGGQIVGGQGAGKRIDVLATALHAGFALDEMINLDLGYSPPFSPAWDPVIIAVRQAAGMA